MGYKAAVIIATGTLGAIVTEIFGGWNTDITTLVIFMAVDFILGILTAGVFKKSDKTETGALSSNAAFQGFCKKGVILVLVLIAHRLDILMGTDFIRSGAVVGFCANELLSIVENVALMGVPMPSVIIKALDILRKKSDDDDKDDKGEK
jgi:toxin secretion/phage lysis holin